MRGEMRGNRAFAAPIQAVEPADSTGDFCQVFANEPQVAKVWCAPRKKGGDSA